MLLGILGVSILGNMLTGKWFRRAEWNYNKINHMFKIF